MTRKLLSTRRTVASALTQYLSAWSKVRSFVEEQGAHAWFFQSDEHPHLYIEFIEWKQSAGTPALTAHPQLAELRASLEQFGPSTDDFWTQPSEE